ncbi:MAG: hypothetical protein WC677_02445 [Clostridia bacterium]|jgi:hypothetical protein
MKITDFAILVCFIFLSASLSIDISQRKLIQTENLKTNYDEIMYMATEDAAGKLIEVADEESYEDFADGNVLQNPNLKLNINKALSSFYKTLYLNMGIENDLIAQNGIKVFLPVKIVVANDGFHVNACEEVRNETGKKEVAEIWLPEKPYSYYDQQSKLVVNFTLNDYLFAYDTLTGKYIEGKAFEFEQIYPQASLFRGTDKIFENKDFEETNFDKTRRRVIIDMIREDLEFYTYRYNYIAKQNGESYSFNIPYISLDQWKNTINNISFIAFLQGLPVGPDKYSTFGFGGSKLIRSDILYTSGQAFEGGLYHLKNCPVINQAGSLSGLYITDSFTRRFEAAEAGYHPCKICNP